MKKFNTNNLVVSCFLSLCLMVVSSCVWAEKKALRSMNAQVQSAGFRFSAEEVVEATKPIITYQQNIHMLSGIDDRVTLKIFGNGRVLAHYPVYMKNAGDYEMQIGEAELLGLIASLSSDGMMDFDEKKIKRKVRADEKALREKGQLFAISDVVESVVDIHLDEYQKNRSSQRINNFYRQFRWKNIEHDAKRFKKNDDLIKANRSITNLKIIMKDSRLIKRERK